LGLKKELNLLDIFSIASGAMISSGIFILPGLAYAQTGPAAVLSYFFAGLLALPGVLSQSELATAMPKAGGAYFYVTRSLGPAVGTINGLITWFSISLKSAFALIGMATFLKILVNFDMHIIAVVLTVCFVILNITGVKEAGRFQVFLVLALMGLMVLYVGRGLSEVAIHNLTPFTTNGVGAIFSTAGFVFVSYGGLLKIASIAEETRNPGKTIPRGMFLSLFVVSIFYALVVFVTVGVLGPSLGNSPITHQPSMMPLTDGAEVFLGNAGKIAMSIAAMLAFISTANAGIMAASRYPMALSRDNLLPQWIGKVSQRFGTPIRSILSTGILMILVVFLQLEILVKAASTVILFTFLFSSIAVVILRESKVENYQPSFKTPFYPWVQIIGVLGYIFLIVEMGMEALLMSLGLVFIGFLVYLFYGKIRSKKEYALLHLMRRITNKEFVSRKLETELKEIIRERDKIVKDRFDEVVEEGLVYDIEKSISRDELFSFIAKKMAPRLDMKQEKFFKLLKNREEESSTALTSFLAIPHIVVEGVNEFDIMLLRTRKGVYFSQEYPDIKAIFVLAGSRDQRNFHLRAISSIAQIIQAPDFRKKWLGSRGEEGLRDIVLLGKRKRSEED
jgi:amino acid transporter/mannitol/fructose-specific phosphotransferase system IIA component (Ntr-type)